MFQVSGTSDRIWNLTELIAFLSQHQRQHIELEIVPEAICLESLGLYKLIDCFEFASVVIHTWNPLEQHDRYIIKFKGANFWFKQTQDISTELHDWDERYTFLCLYHRPTAGRLGIASYAQQYNSAIHFSSDNDADSVPQLELGKLLDYDVPSVQRAGALIQQLPILQSSRDKLTAFTGYDYTDPLTDIYRSILVDLVVESHVQGTTFFPTEKTVRPMLLKKPFIVFGSANYLDYLHQMGFLTFNDFWDENYDGYERGDRLRKIYQTIDFIASRSTAQLITMYWDMKYILDHNYDLLMQQKFKTKITKL